MEKANAKQISQRKKSIASTRGWLKVLALERTTPK
jgi:hypothetical protein